ncbi:cell division protein FtsL [Lactobacillus sp. LC28-10]|uniref:Cell division protein FtsL n=1 Tax=Secundilactobacillus angelensis TaxID=2722706 RepID=A0ABX1KYH6_9LACO|nr:cell division protein FtsL [Secundilactobacillus angelensis]MCH5463138.1 cell division protein FtsL [Secundilactobacillus angelensis]NLR18991.1 cell division protein FtsL [Secundilactobacillus angelensis]
MAQNNLATQFQPQAFPEQPTVPLHSPSTQVVTKPKALPVSKFEKCLCTLGGLILLGMMLMLVSTKIGVSTTQQHLQDVETKITKLENQNTSDRQTINELMNRSRLEKVAKQNGMTLSNSKVRNVNK